MNSNNTATNEANRESTHFMVYSPDPLLQKYFQKDSYFFQPRKGGMNNTTFFVEAGTERFVLRIYETHKDFNKVSYEHYILSELAKLELFIKTPVPVAGQENKTVQFTEDGKPAALFHYIDGVTPGFENPIQLKSFGMAAGGLLNALGSIESKLKPVYRPYYELDNTHPECPLHKVISFCERPSSEFDKYRSELLEVAAQLMTFRERAASFKMLPHQLIHGDLNASNVLADTEGNISAILDFEFVTEDLRIMELCVCLSEIINMKQEEAELWGKLKAFIEGYGKHVRLHRTEADVVPVLIMLRRLDVFVHFLGRYWEGIDSKEILLDQTKNIVAQAQWLNVNRESLMSLIELLL